MANPRKTSLYERERTHTKLRIRCAESLRHMEEQTSLAREMIKRVHQMCERAEEMRKPPNIRWRDRALELTDFASQVWRSTE